MFVFEKKSQETFAHSRGFQRRAFSTGVLLAGAVIVACGNASGRVYLFNTPATLDVPFSAATKGSVAEGVLRVRAEDGYTFYLRLESKGDAVDGDRVRKLVGIRRTDRFGKVIETDPCLKVPLRLQIIRLSGNSPHVVLDENFANERIEGGDGRTFYNVITGLILAKGIYHIKVEGSDDNAELNGVPVYLNVHVPYRS